MSVDRRLQGIENRLDALHELMQVNTLFILCRSFNIWDQ